MELIFRKNFFGIARIYGPGTNFSTGGRIKILPYYKFSQIYMHYISLDCTLSMIYFLTNQLFWVYNIQKTALKPY